MNAKLTETEELLLRIALHAPRGDGRNRPPRSPALEAAIADLRALLEEEEA